MNIIARRKIWYRLSLALLIPCTLALIAFGLRLGIDFTGGSVLEVQGQVQSTQLEEIAKNHKMDNISSTSGGNNTVLLRYRQPQDQPNSTQQKQLEQEITKQGGRIVSFNEIGPSVSKDLVKNALLSILFMSLMIIIYITYVFRKVPKGVSALSFGVTAIQALVHDVLFVLGVFAVLGRFMHVEVDTYIVTAVLTVIGFSVHDTIVVFDRIHENLGKSDEPFEKVVNNSLQETLVRSLNTSLVVVVVLFALFLFGGASTRYFVLALILGMLAGTYSSIFVASPLLVSWHNIAESRKPRSRKP